MLADCAVFGAGRMDFLCSSAGTACSGLSGLCRFIPDRPGLTTGISRYQEASTLRRKTRYTGHRSTARRGSIARECGNRQISPTALPTKPRDIAVPIMFRRMVTTYRSSAFSRHKSPAYASTADSVTPAVQRWRCHGVVPFCLRVNRMR